MTLPNPAEISSVTVAVCPDETLTVVEAKVLPPAEAEMVSDFTKDGAEVWAQAEGMISSLRAAYNSSKGCGGMMVAVGPVGIDTVTTTVLIPVDALSPLPTPQLVRPNSKTRSKKP